MEPVERYWRERITRLKEVLESNNFQVFLADSAKHAKTVVQEEILPGIGAKTVSWGGSKTFIDTGLYHAMKDDTTLEFVNPFAEKVSLEESIELRRRAFFVDLFITGTNAITEAGQLVNLDRTGNRVAAIAFGPKSVIILAGKNKIVSDTDDAILRIKSYAAPLVAMRLNAKTPCVETSYCQDCKSQERVCNVWGIVEKSYPKGRIKIVLINEDLGF